MSYLKYLPAGILLLAASICFLATRAGDNVDARALAGIMSVPGLFFLLLAILAALVAWAL